MSYDVKYCTKCGNLGEASIVTEKTISVVSLIVLLALGILPGIIYIMLGGSSTKRWQCTSCHQRGCLIPADSQRALRALAKGA
jgi:hypothetical protein